jgi:hypothetical protein
MPILQTGHGVPLLLELDELDALELDDDDEPVEAPPAPPEPDELEEVAPPEPLDDAVESPVELEAPDGGTSTEP